MTTPTLTKEEAAELLAINADRIGFSAFMGMVANQLNDCECATRSDDIIIEQIKFNLHVRLVGRSLVPKVPQ